MKKGTDIKRRISDGESATLEFKKSTGQLNRAGETLCAFLNGDGGTVIVGGWDMTGQQPHRRLSGPVWTLGSRCRDATERSWVLLQFGMLRLREGPR